MVIRLVILLAVLNTISLKGSKVVISLYAIDLGANPFSIGILVAMYAFFPLLLAVYAGKISDRFGVRFPMLFGSFGLWLGLLLPYLMPRLPALYFSAAMIGAAHVFFHVSVHNLIGSLGDAEARTRNFSRFSLWAAVSTFIGPLFAGFSIDHSGHAVTYFYLSLVALLSGVILFFSSKVIPKGEKKPEEHHKKSVMDLVKNGPLRRTFITSGVVLTGIELFTFYFPIYGHSIGLSASSIGIVLSAYAAAAFVVRSSLPALVKKYSEDAILTHSLFVAGSAYLLFPFFQNVLVLILVAFILGLGLGCGQPLSIMQTYTRSPAGRSGEALGVRITVNKLTQFAVPIFFGSIGAAFGLIPVFWANALFLVTGGYINSSGKGGEHVSAARPLK